MQRKAAIISTVRTPVGKAGGALALGHPLPGHAGPVPNRYDKQVNYVGKKSRNFTKCSVNLRDFFRNLFGNYTIRNLFLCVSSTRVEGREKKIERKACN